MIWHTWDIHQILLRIDPTYDINNLGCLKLSHWPKIKHKGEKSKCMKKKGKKTKKKKHKCMCICVSIWPNNCSKLQLWRKLFIKYIYIYICLILLMCCITWDFNSFSFLEPREYCLAVCLKAGQGRYNCNIIEFRFYLNCHLGQKKLVGYFGHSL